MVQFPTEPSKQNRCPESFMDQQETVKHRVSGDRIALMVIAAVFVVTALVFAWTRKEFKNLLLINQTGVRCPMPVTLFENVLVMEFIGENGKAAPPIKERPPKDLEKAYVTITEWLAKLLFKAELAYADFSEYNILNNGEELVLIDAGQAVLTTHPEAEAFFERDLRNVAAWFSKKGLEKSFEQLKTDVKALKEKI